MPEGVAPAAPSPVDLIRTLHTLGPTGTNLEAAARRWLDRRGLTGSGTVVLHPSLESALEGLPRTGAHALVACAVYPHLHTLVFDNLRTCRMVDSFLMPTHEMVLAVSATAPSEPRTVATHPAPASLVPPTCQARPALSNAQAAIDCAGGAVDACITTAVAARAHALRIVHNFGAVPMVFTVHQVIEAAP
ncbi:bacilysin biosynthesis protein BacA [Streptomyces sp. NPDC057702]|uniref:bacilysin biosynthesis protein BacA n=1 Tax=unclassified Streptomyces TaxID=2593676 RepID=UPI003679669D